MDTRSDSVRLAVDGGKPVRRTLLPYGRQWVDDEDIAAVLNVLRGDWLTTGPMVEQFEANFAASVGARHAVAVTSGTAALHTAVAAIGLEPSDEVIVPALTFAATANCVLYQRGKPIFVDVDGATLLVAPAEIERVITDRTRALIAVDYAGQPCNYVALQEICSRRNLVLIADACHSLGGAVRGRRVGTLAALTAFSFHPVKHITSGEGGMITTDEPALAARMRAFRNHGITTDHRQRETVGSWFYEMVDLGFNYRLTDLQCALGNSQLKKLDAWVRRRREIAKRYDDAFRQIEALELVQTAAEVEHAYHLYVVRLRRDRLRADRTAIFRALRAEGIGVNVHYIPVHLHPYYRQHLGTSPGTCPVAESEYERLISLPIFPRMTDGDVADVLDAVRKVLVAYAA